MADQSDIKNNYFKIKTKKEESESKTETSALSEISISLATYNDIFSDFDPRPFSQRALSDDFLMEIKKATKVKDHETIDLQFIISEEKQNVRDESIIKKRLQDYFSKHLRIAKKETQNIRKRGLTFILCGATLLLGATYLHQYMADSFLATLLFVIAEPGGWFSTWTGFEKLFHADSFKKNEFNFYKRMTQAEINFIHY